MVFLSTMLDIYKDTCLELQGLHSSTTPPQTTASEMTTDSLNKNRMFQFPQRWLQSRPLGLHDTVQGCQNIMW